MTRSAVCVQASTLFLRRVPTAHGVMVLFAPRPGPAPRAAYPVFCPGHPGVAFMRAYSEQVLAGVGLPGRFRVNGRWLDGRPGAADVAGEDGSDDDRC